MKTCGVFTPSVVTARVISLGSADDDLGLFADVLVFVEEVDDVSREHRVHVQVGDVRLLLAPLLHRRLVVLLRVTPTRSTSRRVFNWF